MLLLQIIINESSSAKEVNYGTMQLYKCSRIDPMRTLAYLLEIVVTLYVSLVSNEVESAKKSNFSDPLTVS